MAQPPPRLRRRIRVLIADREGIFRIGLRKLLALEDDLRVVAQAEDSAQTIGLARKFKPDVLLIQAEIASKGSNHFFERVRRAWPRGKILITASALLEDEALRYVKAGASGAILKSVEPELFVKGIRRVMGNEIWLPKRPVTEKAKPAAHPERADARPADTLTHREKTIISHLVLGCRNREIAKNMNITEQTVKNYLRTIYDKVGVSDRLELALYAIHKRMELPPVESVPF